MKKCVNVICDISPAISFGLLARDFILGLVDRGWQVRVCPFLRVESKETQIDPRIKALIALPEPTWPRFVVHHMSEMLALNVHEGDVLYTLWETTQLPEHMVPFINRAKAVVVSSEHNKTVFAASGITCPIYVLPLGVDEKVFFPSQAFPKGKIFATAGRGVHGRVRKGLDRVILGFLYAFPTETDVVLRVKDHIDCPPSLIQDERVQLINRFLTQEDMVRFYQEALCFVSGATCEGWGLHQQEAMMCGKPLISVCYGGVKMFFQGDVHGCALPYTMQPTTDYFVNSGEWAVPSIEDIAKAFRAVYAAPRDFYLRGLKGCVDVQKFTLTAMQQNLSNLLGKVL